MRIVVTALALLSVAAFTHPSCAQGARPTEETVTGLLGRFDVGDCEVGPSGGRSGLRWELTAPGASRPGFVRLGPDGGVESAVIPRSPWDVGLTALSAEQLADAARAALVAVRKHPRPEWDLVLARRPERTYGGSVTVSVLEMREVDGEPVVGSMAATIDVAIDSGRVTRLDLTEGGPAPLPPPRLLAEARAAAAPMCDCDVADLTTLSVRRWATDPRCPEAQESIWVMTVVGPPDGAAPVAAATAFFTDTALVKVIADHPVDRAALDERSALAGDMAAAIAHCLAVEREVADTLPVWSPALGAPACLSVRTYPGAPVWMRKRAAMGAHPLACLVPGWSREAAHLSTAGSTFAETTAKGEVHFVDLLTGDAFDAWGPKSDATCEQTVLSPDATFIAYTAYRRHGDQDIFIDKIDWNARCTSRHRRIVRVDGPDERPVFSPDGEWVYYAHAEEGAAEGEASLAPTALVWSLCRVRSDAPHQNTEVEEVLAGFGRVGRMSFFPDGRRLLVWHEGGLDVVDVEARTKEPLGLPDLFDPDLLGGPPLKIQDPVVSPDGTRLAFSGYRDAEASDKLSGWYIYVCNLDGSGLERITPLEDDPVEFYVFPESGKSAFDLEKEMILEREWQEAKGR